VRASLLQTGKAPCPASRATAAGAASPVCASPAFIKVAAKVEKVNRQISRNGLFT